MRKVLVVLLAVNTLFLGVLIRKPSPVVYSGGGVSQNGDVNGDGRIDIADGIYIISYQFRGGPPPVPFECASAPCRTRDTCARPSWA